MLVTESDPDTIRSELLDITGRLILEESRESSVGRRDTESRSPRKRILERLSLEDGSFPTRLG